MNTVSNRGARLAPDAVRERPRANSPASERPEERRRVLRRRAECASTGFTLIELVTSVTVLALIIGPLTTATVLFLEHGRDPVGVFADDGTIRAATALFVADVESAETVTAPDAGPCGSTEPALLTTTWDDRGTVYRASWFAIPASTFTTIVRRRCTGTSLISTVVVGDVAGAPSIACTPSCNAPTTLTLSGVSASGSVFTVAAPRRAP